MSDIVGVSENRGMALAAFLLDASEALHVGAVDSLVWDAIDILNAEVDYTWEVTEQLGFHLGGQSSDQRSFEDDLIAGNPSKPGCGARGWR